MKSQFIIMALLCIIGFTAYNQNAWIKTSLQDKHTVSCMISIGTDLVVGTTGDGIYKSNDNGESWQKKTNGLIVNRIMAMTISGASTVSYTHLDVYKRQALSQLFSSFE